MNNKHFEIARFQYITTDHPRISHAEQACRAFKAGCKWVQIRMKNWPLYEIEKQIRQAIEAANQYNAILIIDDYVDIAARLNASGVHLGKLDMDPYEARKILGDNYLIGSTANTFNDIELLCQAPIQYIGLGPFRFTHTKKNLSPIIGIDGYRNIMKKVADTDISIPIIAIGGITFNDIPFLLETGIYGVAVSASIAFSQNFEKSIHQFVQYFENIHVKQP